MNDRSSRVCPVENAGSLDNRIRRWLQNPSRILEPHVHEGMTAMDVGCGPGFFTVDMARLVGASGRVIACDLQDEMLAKVRDKVRGTALEDRITLHRCEANRIGYAGEADFALAFYMVHELPDREAFFAETAGVLKPGGRMLVVEPPFHVSRAAFAESLRIARTAGFTSLEGPRLFLSKTAILRRD